ncbi:5-formyltetrahydrofolate cyclo-ligase [Lysinibacillus sp. 54212]|uniref:5-formyltetrahydrofolate cyclo-ligase n=1 Tax=Lysinibacillus sp. 54212 TaxID=3119829 RepID=UPI002FC6E750
MDKKTERLKMKKQLNELSKEEYIERSQIIHQKLLQEPSIINAETIALTISNFPEVDTRKLIESLWKLNKRVAVPKCNPKTKEMTFYAIQGFHQLESVYYNLQEPIEERTDKIQQEQMDVIIVPGIVFDKRGLRIGFGGGYYDRYLPTFTGKLISLAFDEQVVAWVPNESYDVPVHLIISDKDIYNCINVRREY